MSSHLLSFFLIVCLRVFFHVSLPSLYNISLSVIFFIFSPSRITVSGFSFSSPHSIWVRILTLQEWESSFFMSEIRLEIPPSIWVRILIQSKWERLEISLFFLSLNSILIHSFSPLQYSSLFTPLFHLNSMYHLFQFPYLITRSPL